MDTVSSVLEADPEIRVNVDEILYWLESHGLIVKGRYIASVGTQACLYEFWHETAETEGSEVFSIRRFLSQYYEVRLHFTDIAYEVFREFKVSIYDELPSYCVVGSESVPEYP